MKITKEYEKNVATTKESRQKQWIEIFEYYDSLTFPEVSQYKKRMMTAEKFGCSECKVTTAISYAMKFKQN